MKPIPEPTVSKEDIDKYQKEWLKERWNNEMYPMHDWLHKHYKTLEEALSHIEDDLKYTGPPSEPPEKILRDILEHQEDPKIVEEAMVEANIVLLKKLLKQKLILCPHCGKPCLVWGCCGEPLLEEKKG